MNIKLLCFLSLAWLVAPDSASCQSVQPPQQPPQAANIDGLLAGWEKALTSLKSISMDCKRTTKDKVFETTDEYRGAAKLARSTQANPGVCASLELYKVVGGKIQPDRFEKYLFNGDVLYEYSPANKVIRKHVIGPTKSGRRDENLMSFFFAKGAPDIAKRYRLSLEPPKDNYYFIVKVEPKLDQDRAEFSVAYVALFRSSLLTAMVELRQPNGNVVRWDFSNIQPNAAIDERAFAPPEPPPPGWHLERVSNTKMP